MEILENVGQSGSKIIGSLKTIISDAEDVLANSTQTGSESYENAKKKLESTLTDAKFLVGELNEVMVHKAKDAAVVTVEYARDNPWKTGCVIAAIGILVGVLLSKKH